MTDKEATEKLTWLLDHGYLIMVDDEHYRFNMEPIALNAHLETLGYNLDSFTESDNKRVMSWQNKNVTCKEIDAAYEIAKVEHPRPELAALGKIIGDNRRKAKTEAPEPVKKQSANRQHQLVSSDPEAEDPKLKAHNEIMHQRRNDYYRQKQGLT